MPSYVGGPKQEGGPGGLCAMGMSTKISYQMSSLTLDIGARRGVVRLFVLKGMCKSFKLDK